ncbi:MAG: hypothetical protein HOC23_11395 [Halieaceae bacterium]|jgi:hypothetical protein|nr:hypothetical protein [Gammaproteobacteria bacterium]MBT4520601.1 hypothetical protein [Halieaceae bacterium]
MHKESDGEEPLSSLKSEMKSSSKTVQDYATEYSRIAEPELPISSGFSARLNMLWDLAGAVPSQTEGRVLGIMGINSNWRESDVRSWLQRDVLPPRLELHNIVKFLVNQLQGSHNVLRWEAFLIYGSPIVPSPVDTLMYREDQARRDIATMIFAQITEKYQIPPSAYQAEVAFQRCLTFMHNLNIYELRDFQPGHMEPFKNYMFPSTKK